MAGDLFSSFFDPTGKVAPTYEELQQRKKIAAAIMARQGRQPRNLGEGLQAIGEAFFERQERNKILEDEAAMNAVGDAAAQKYMTPGGSQTYAPPDEVPPGVAAINRAAPIVPVQPQQARAISSPPQAPGGGATPVAAGPGGMVEPGDYNEIDAADPRNRYRPPPAYLAPALDRNIRDPERRGYLGQLAAKEAQSPTEVSPTGAAGPFQFTRGTGAQYGIPGNARFDPDASTVAANRFTDDNVKALTARLGREPTPGEMALAHQQGAGTAANMLTGAGNAPGRNLAVNNVPASMGPQAAANKIMGYYGMPGGGATGPGSPRDAVATTLLAQAQPQGRPSAADYGQPLALAATPQPDAGIQPAPPAAPPIRSAPQPQQQVAQAQPQAGHVLELGPEPTPPPTMTPVQQNMLRDIQNTPPGQRVVVQKALQPLWEQEDAKVKQAHETYKIKAEEYKALKLKREDQLTGAAKDIANVEHIRQQIATGKIIQMEGRAFRVQDDGTLKDITPGQTGEGPPQIKMTQDQSDTLKFYKMGKTAAAQLEGKEHILAEGWKDELLGKVPFAGNKLMSSQYRAAKNAAGLLVQADLRDTSGATIGTQEYKDRFALLMPVAGDDGLAQRNKAEARKAVLEGQRLALGSARPMADYVDKEHAKERAERVASLNREMEGKDRNKTYEKNGIFRKWAGDHWEEH